MLNTPSKNTIIQQERRLSSHHKDTRQYEREKLYKMWPGKNILLFQGRLIIGPDAWQLVATIVLILTILLAFEAFEASYFMILHPAGIIVLIVPIIAAVFIYVALFYTATIDPGILPRRCVVYNNLRNENPDKEDQSNQYPPLFQSVYVNHKEMILKFCYTCELYRPPRASHCPRCDNCVEKFDHHCPWTGTCIGKRNYRPFIYFVTFTAISLVIGICICIFQIIYSSVKLAAHPFKVNGKTIWEIICTIASAPIALICLIALIFVGTLFGFHSYLICTGQTTYESIKKKRGRSETELNKGIVQNVFNEYLCAPCESSRLPFRKPLGEYRRVAVDMINPPTHIDSYLENDEQTVDTPLNI